MPPTAPNLLATVSRALLFCFSSVVANGNSGTAATIAWPSGANQALTLTGNCTLAFTAPPGICDISIFLTQDTTGGRTVTWPAGIKWKGATAPTLSTSASAIDYITFFYDGTHYWGIAYLDVASPLGIIADGDSISAGDISGTPEVAHQYSTLATSEMPGGYGSVDNIAVVGEEFSTMLANLSTNVYPVITSIHSAGRKAICSCMGGTNDIHLGDTASQVYTTASSYFQDCKSNGADFCVAWTLMGAIGEGAGFEATRQSFNTMLRSGYASIGVDYLVDIGADPSMGNANSSANSTLFQSDEIHPTAFGYTILGNYFAMTLLQIGSSCTVSSISPNSGGIGSTHSVTITGSGFTDAIQVLVGGLAVSSFTVVSDTEITATTTTGFFAGAGPVSVFGQKGSGILASGWTWM